LIFEWNEDNAGEVIIDATFWLFRMTNDTRVRADLGLKNRKEVGDVVSEENLDLNQEIDLSLLLLE
jgi:hypothetical protein